MKLFILLILVSNFFVFAQVYPNWFFNQGDYQGSTVVFGYSIDECKNNAANISSAYDKCFVDGFLEAYISNSNPDILELINNSKYYYEFSRESLYKQVKSNIIIDQFKVNVLTDLNIAIFHNDTIRVKNNLISVDTLSMPDWINRDFAEDSTFYFGTGYFTSKGNEGDSWIRAEEQAVFNILRNNNMKLFQLHLSEEIEKSENTFEIAKLYKFKFELSNIQVMKRYTNLNHKQNYVLVRIPKNNVKSFLK